MVISKREEGVSKRLEAIPNRAEGISERLEGVSNWVEDAPNALKGVWQAFGSSSLDVKLARTPPPIVQKRTVLRVQLKVVFVLLNIGDLPVYYKGNKKN